MPCWVMPGWMERYRTCFQTGGMTVEEGMNHNGALDMPAHAIKQQVAMLIALREQGALKHVKSGTIALENQKVFNPNYAM